MHQTSEGAPEDRGTGGTAGMRAGELRLRAAALRSAADSAAAHAAPAGTPGTGHAIRTCSRAAAALPGGTAAAGCRSLSAAPGVVVAGGGGAESDVTSRSAKPGLFLERGSAEEGARAKALGRVVWAREKGWNAWPALVVSAADAVDAAPKLSRAHVQVLRPGASSICGAWTGCSCIAN